MAKLAPLVSVVALLSANVSAAADTAPRKPVGSWIVDFDDAQCVASRDYGTAEAPLTLALKAAPVGNLMQVVLAIPSSGEGEAEHSPATISVDGRPAIQTNMIAFSTPGSQQRQFRINLPQDQFASVGAARTIRISGGGLDYQFELAQMAPLKRIMDKCSADLRQVWNAGSEGSGVALRERASGDFSGLMEGDYPAFLAEGLKGGSARVAVLVDESGRVADCMVVETSGVAALDAHSCAMIRDRVQFKPAIGANGQPAKDTYLQTVSWELE